MDSHSLFVSAPRNKLRVTLTLAGSLIFHGSLIGVAALWTTCPIAPPPVITTEIMEAPTSSDVPVAAALPSDPEPQPPVLTTTEPAEQPPPELAPSTDDMTLSVLPTPPSSRQKATPGHSSATSLPRASRTAQTLSTGPTVPGSTSASGAGRFGVRWNVPRPIYPQALRLAHVQGSGSVRVTTDGSGRVADAVIVQTTGNSALDRQTCETARLRWTGPPNAATTVPFTYELQ